METIVRGKMVVGFALTRVGMLAVLAVFEGCGTASAQQAVTIAGAPQQVIPYAQEPGVPAVTIPAGTVNPYGGDGGVGGGTGGGTGSSGTTGDTPALETMENQSWGLQAIQNAQSLGVNPSALAATCVLESGCVQPVGGSGAQGVFQMYPAAFQEGLQTALAANPALSSQVVSGSAGMNDPTTEAIAASGYLMQANQSLEAAGVSNPTVLDVRSYYEFGPTYGSTVAQAPPTATMSSLLPASFLASNGISATETVSQWQASVSNKIGGAAGQTVLT
jgi:hypothetical protein